MTDNINELLQKICTRETASYPVMEMEKVIGLGEVAVEDIISCLERKRGFPRPDDDLPLQVMLGEIRSPKAIDILIEYLKDSKYDITAEVACEGLAKIGSIAIPPLKEIVATEEGEAIRLYAYAALGYMRNDEAHNILINQLETDRRLTCAIALSRYKNREDVEKIYKVYRELPENVFNPDIEESIWFCVNPDHAPLPVDENWRVRYRRKPHYSYSPAISQLGIMRITYSAIRKNRNGLANLRKSLKKLSLEEILSKDMSDLNKDERCGDCKKPVVYQAGIPVCPAHTAYGMAVFQEEFIKESIRQGYDNAPEVVDELDELYEDADKIKKTSKKRDNLDKVAVYYNTMDYFIERRIYSLKDILSELSKIKEEAEKSYRAEFGTDPMYDLIMQDEPREQAKSNKIGRNEPCPCGSGKKYKKCCGA
jgi:uncharacterized Zn finger protein (UPF0148 family)